MADTFHTTLEETTESENATIIRRQLYEFNLGVTVPDEHRTLAVYLWDERGRLMGGLLGGTAWGWLYISIFWLDERVRGQGHGARILAEAEEEGRKRGCKHAYLDTFEYQAPGFYEKHGYTEWGRLDDFPPGGHSRIFFRKDL